MAQGDIPLLAMLQSRFGYLSQQQRGIAVNVANSDTPGFVPTDLKSFSYSLKGAAAASGGKLPMASVSGQAGFLQGHASAAAKVWQAQAAPDSEARLDGNQVVLEEQMMKMGKVRGDYDAAINFYEKAVGMLQLAIKPPGKP